MNFFDKQLDDFQRLYPDAGRGGRSRNGLTGPDWASIGLQVAGGAMMDKSAEEELEREEEKERLARILGERDRRTMAQQNVVSEQQGDRSLNMAGAQALAGMRASALQNRKLYSTRKAFLGAF